MKRVYAKNRAAWRAWLSKHAARESEIWLIFYKKATGKPSIPYEDAVEEALCFGWIDGKVMKFDEARYIQRFTPRKPKSRWSESNLRRVKRMLALGAMTPAGLSAYDPKRRLETPPMPTDLPNDLKRRFKSKAKAWKNFSNFPPGYRRMAAGWVASAKKDETRLRRLAQLVDCSARNERLAFI
jgi:uncharacterized protein YdeI (YjbR/CyaY-like superfamily)